MQLPITHLERRQAPPLEAARVALGAIALGVFTQALFFRTGVGFTWFLWDLLLVAVTLTTLGRGRVGAAGIATATACALFGFAFVMRRSAFTAAIALPANVAFLIALPIVVSENLSFRELPEVPLRLLRTLPFVPSAIGRTVTIPRDAVVALDGGERHVVRRTLAGLLLGLPLAGFFALLLCADSYFAHTLARAEARVSTAVSFSVQAALTGVVFMFGYALFARRNEEQRSEAESPDAPYRTVDEPSALPNVSPLTWGIVLAQVAAVFLVYVVVHRDTEFGGHGVVHSRADITYASHLHAGFYQLLFATILAVCLVVAGHRILRGRADEATVPGGLALRAIEASLLVFTGLTLFSCVNRLRLYEEAYGATNLRVGVGFVALAAFAVLLCTLTKSIVRDMRAFGAITLCAMTACALVAAFFDADGYIARTNLDRASRGKTLDAVYLVSLSADACVAAEHPVLRNDPALRGYLLDRWRTNSRVDDVRARRGFVRCPSP